MNTTLINLISFGTTRLVGILEELNQEKWFIQPEGFANNIAWNVGHLLVVRQNLVYRNSGLDPNVSGMGSLYKPGTSPADWESQPDTAALLEKLKACQAQLQADAAAGIFDNVEYNKFELGGIPMNTVEDGAAFSLWHEALHMGVITSILDVATV